MIAGDSGYPNLYKLVTPYKRDATATAQDRRKRRKFNRRLSKGRILVENTIGALKMRFPALKNTMRIRRKNFSTLLVACCIIHNMMIGMGIPVPDAGIGEQFQDQDYVEPTAGGDAWEGEDAEVETTRQTLCDLVSTLPALT